jgi:hypothetical protein
MTKFNILPFIIKALKKLGTEGMFLNIIKAIFDKPRTNNILNGEKLKLFSLMSGMRQEYPLPPFLLKTVLGCLGRAIGQKKVKRIQLVK